MKLEVGKLYRTRSGSKAHVADSLVTPFGENQVFSGSVDSGKFIDWIHWEADGAAGDEGSGENDFDLVEEWRDPVTYTHYVHLLRNKETGETKTYASTVKCEASSWLFFDLLDVKEVSFTI